MSSHPNLSSWKIKNQIGWESKVTSQKQVSSIIEVNKIKEKPIVKKTSETTDEPPTVEFIGKFDGRFIGTGSEIQSIDWVPKQTGLFFIETFVWDRNNVPIADQGPFVLIIVN